MEPTFWSPAQQVVINAQEEENLRHMQAFNPNKYAEVRRIEKMFDDKRARYGGGFPPDMPPWRPGAF